MLYKFSSLVIGIDIYDVVGLIIVDVCLELGW